MDGMCALIKRLGKECMGKASGLSLFYGMLLLYRKIESAMEFNTKSLVSNLQL